MTGPFPRSEHPHTDGMKHAQPHSLEHVHEHAHPGGKEEHRDQHEVIDADQDRGHRR